MSAIKIKIGIALSGASTGGAYEAGVVDFLLEALQQWEAVDGVDAPCVELSNIAGTSAGGITSTLTVASLNNHFEPLPHDFKRGAPEPKNNPLFQTWVKKMHYTHLFAINDILRPGSRILSYLNANFMKDTADAVLKNEVKPTALPAYCDGIELSVTSTNLTGVPYFVTFDNDEKFLMHDHEDHTTFIMSNSNGSDVTSADHDVANEQGHYPLDPLDRNRSRGNWSRLKLSAQATAAYPKFFPSVNLDKEVTAYENRWKIPPTWPPAMADNAVLHYDTVDGGWSNKDPFGLVLRQMKKKNFETGKEFADVVILVDPFPASEQSAAAYVKESNEGLGVFKIGTKESDAMYQQSCLKEGLLSGEFDQYRETTKMFALYPKGPKHVYTDTMNIICATQALGDFGGMLDEDIRLHDYKLGRKNCQDFLLKYMTFEQLKIAKQDDATATDLSRPVIPLRGTAAKPCPEPEWPNFSGWKKFVLAIRVGLAAALRACMLLVSLPNNCGSKLFMLFTPLLIVAAVLLFFPIAIVVAAKIFGTMEVYSDKSVVSSSAYGSI